MNGHGPKTEPTKELRTRTIKRYQNRKLYDTTQSCYVTLEEIAQIVREGHNIRVLDNKTGNDITYITQIQLLFDQERKADKLGDVELLDRVIRSTDGTFSGYAQALENSQENGLKIPTKNFGVTTISEGHEVPFESQLNSGKNNNNQDMSITLN